MQQVGLATYLSQDQPNAQFPSASCHCVNRSATVSRPCGCTLGRNRYSLPSHLVVCLVWGSPYLPSYSSTKCTGSTMRRTRKAKSVRPSHRCRRRSNAHKRTPAANRGKRVLETSRTLRTHTFERVPPPREEVVDAVLVDGVLRHEEDFVPLVR